MNEAEIIQKMKEGWELKNRGTGWWITKPRLPYRPWIQEQIPDETIEAMKKKGILKTELPGMTIIGTLTPLGQLAYDKNGFQKLTSEEK